MLRVALYVWHLRINLLPIFIWKTPPELIGCSWWAALSHTCRVTRCKAAGHETSGVVNSILLQAAAPGAPPAWASLQLPAPPSSGTSPPESWTFFHTINFPHNLPCSVAPENSCSSLCSSPPCWGVLGCYHSSPDPSSAFPMPRVCFSFFSLPPLNLFPPVLGSRHTEPAGHAAEAVAELESVTDYLETQIDLQMFVKSPEPLAVLNLTGYFSCIDTRLKKKPCQISKKGPCTHLKIVYM